MSDKIKNLANTLIILNNVQRHLLINIKDLKPTYPQMSSLQSTVQS